MNQRSHYIWLWDCNAST